MVRASRYRLSAMIKLHGLTLKGDECNDSEKYPTMHGLLGKLTPRA